MEKQNKLEGMMHSTAKSLEELKEEEVKLEFVSHYSLKKVMEGIIRWPSIFAGNKIIQGQESLWDGVIINQNKLNIFLGPQSCDLLRCLMSANLIYPDGTYNQTYTDIIQQLMSQTKEKKYGR